MSTQSERVDRAIAHLLLHHPWWASLLLNLRRSYTDAIPTMATDGTRLLINEAFAATLSGEDLETVLAHETAHCALLHSYRRGTRDPQAWNIAADQAANALLEADGFVLPPGSIPPSPLHMTAEELYDRIPSCSLPMADIADAGSLGNDASAQPCNPMTANDWRQAVAASRGIMPAGIKRTVEDAQTAKRPWRELLALWTSATIKSADRTWMRPSRRYFPAPGHRREPQTKIALCVDTSGSIDDALLSQFGAEMRGICAVNGIEAYVIACDAAVHAVYQPGDTWRDLPGGGSTDFRPALQKSIELEVDAIVYLTDGYGEFGPAITLPVLWAMSTTNNAPWGYTIHLGGD